jgi:outer membrane protein assembly factor BamB
METNKNHHLRISRGRAMLFIGLAVLIVAGGVVFFSHFSQRKTSHSQPHVNTPANSNAAMFGFDLQRTRYNPSERILNVANVSRLVPYWTASTGSYINSSPAVANGMVYIGSNDKILYAFDAKTGKILWAHDANDGVGSSPAVANGIVYVGSDDHSV